MPTLSTHHLTPHLPITGNFDGLTTEFFRTLVNKLVRENWDEFIDKNIDPSLFFNHDLETGKTRIDYPRIIYHFIDGSFYLTGIGDGALAVDILAGLFEKPFGGDGVLFPGFKKMESCESEIETINNHLFNYRLVNWIPFHFKDYNAFKTLPLKDKVNQLNDKLHKHLVGDMAKYLELNFENLKAEITDISTTNPNAIIYEGHKYYAFDVAFNVNIKFPDFLTLGNNKALGFGRIMPC